MLEEEKPIAPPKPIHGRGASGNPANRFEALHLEPDPEDEHDPERPARRTIYYRDFTRTIIAHNDSPDVGFESSINPYRGCEHGCIYCYARPTHEFLGFSAGTRFREPHHGERGRPRAAGEGTLLAALETADAGHERRDRSVSAGRATVADHAALSRSAGAISQSGRDHHQEPARDPRPRFPGRTCRAPGGGGQHFRDLARSQTPARPRAAHLDSAGPAGGDRAACARQACRSG